jgi:FixJ family two-component response regulator
VVAIVDDEEAVRRAFKRLIVSSGLDAETFASGAEFLQSLADRRPDCLVLDLHMMGVSGFDVQARLAEAKDPLPIVIITGRDSPEIRKRVMDVGPAGYLRKPVDDRVLLEAVTGAIAGKPPSTNKLS